MLSVPAMEHDMEAMTIDSNQEISADQPPPRNRDRYAENVQKKARHSCSFVGELFKASRQRYWESKAREAELEENLARDALSVDSKRRMEQSMRRAEAQYLRFLRTKERPSNFVTRKIIGRGGFGQVKLVQRISDGRVYALKSLAKADMFIRAQMAHVRSERDILAESDSPWVVKLHATFQDTTFLYLLMEFVPGGDLMTMLIKYEVFSEDITRFYMAELTLAIEAVHRLGFIHRDIKPDNILLDRGGHVKLTDFGLSTGFHKEHDASYYQQLLASAQQSEDEGGLEQIQLTVSNRRQFNTWRRSRRQQAYSRVGTPNYTAPELVTGMGYDFICDWWSVGAIMFECLVGWPPFYGQSDGETYLKIVHWPTYLYFPPEQPLDPVTVDFIRRLICYAPNRLGRVGGAHEIKQHPYFNDVPWNDMRSVLAPFAPRLTSELDVQNFPIEDIDQVDDCDVSRASAADQADYGGDIDLPFIGYTYKRFDALRESHA